MIYNRVLNKFIPYNGYIREFCLFRKEIDNEKLLEYMEKAHVDGFNSTSVHELVRYKDGGNPVMKFVQRKDKVRDMDNQRKDKQRKEISSFRNTTLDFFI